MPHSSRLLRYCVKTNIHITKVRTHRYIRTRTRKLSQYSNTIPTQESSLHGAPITTHELVVDGDHNRELRRHLSGSSSSSSSSSSTRELTLLYQVSDPNHSAVLMNRWWQSGSVNVITTKSGFTSAIFLIHSVQAPHGAIGLRWLACDSGLCISSC